MPFFLLCVSSCVHDTHILEIFFVWHSGEKSDPAREWEPCFARNFPKWEHILHCIELCKELSSSISLLFFYSMLLCMMGKNGDNALRVWLMHDEGKNTTSKLGQGSCKREEYFFFEKKTARFYCYRFSMPHREKICNAFTASYVCVFWGETIKRTSQVDKRITVSLSFDSCFQKE